MKKGSTATFAAAILTAISWACLSTVRPTTTLAQSDAADYAAYLYGDANLDGVVSGDDFSVLAGNLGKSISAWDKGDFNYNGIVAGDDFTLLVGSLGKSVSFSDDSLPEEELLAIDSFAAANGLTIPEPATFSLLAIGTIGILSRRRSRV